VEHYLRRGRALAAFNALLAPRSHTMELQSEGKGKSSSSPDLQALLASLTESEEALIASVSYLFKWSFTVRSCWNICGSLCSSRSGCCYRNKRWNLGMTRTMWVQIHQIP
jgi:hypothetical protein